MKLKDASSLDCIVTLSRWQHRWSFNELDKWDVRETSPRTRIDWWRYALDLIQAAIMSHLSKSTHKHIRIIRCRHISRKSFT